MEEDERRGGGEDSHGSDAKQDGCRRRELEGEPPRVAKLGGGVGGADDDAVQLNDERTQDRRHEERRLRARVLAHERHHAERCGHDQPGDGGHRVPLVLPANLTVERDEREPRRGLRHQDRGHSTRELRRDARRREPREDHSEVGDVGEVVLDVAKERVPEVEDVVVDLLVHAEVRVVDGELHERAVRAPLASEGAVRERLEREDEEGGSAIRAELGGRREQITAPYPRHRARETEDGDRRHRLGSRDHHERAADAQEPCTLATLAGPRRGLVEREEGEERHGPDREKQRDLHSAPERPVERSYAEKERRQEVRQEPRRERALLRFP